MVKRIASFLLCGCLISTLLINTIPKAQAAGENNAGEYDSETSPYSETATYFDYYRQNKDNVRPSDKIEIDVLNNNAYKTKQQDGETGILLDKGSSYSWDFSADEEGIYSLFITYCAVAGNDSDILLQLKLDGEYPYFEANGFVLKRLWQDELTEDGAFKKDITGSDLRPQQIEIFQWSRETFIDAQGMYQDPYIFNLTKGRHTITLTVEQPVLISRLTFMNETEVPSYDEYRASIQKESKANKVIRKEAELSLKKNNKVLYPTYDRANAATLPNDPYNILLNTIGQSNWKSPGDYIEWELNEISEPGWYDIYFRVKQSYNTNSFSYRKLKINGEVPFKEAENISFYYDTAWYVQALHDGDGNPLSVFLQPGDILTLECIADETSEITRSINQSVLDLNAIYRQIIVITGTAPDVYRDYSLEAQLPNMLSDLNTANDSLKATAKRIVEITGVSGPNVSTINEMTEILDAMLGNPFTIPEYLASFKDGVQNLGSLLQEVGNQPLEIDCFYFVPEGEALPKTEASFFTSMAFHFKKFVSSFVNNYNTFDNESGTRNKTLTVWVSTGRDQMQIISNMIIDSFSPEYGVNVNLSLVDTGGTLIQATLAGKGPDVALLLPSGTPINLAMRGALVDLSSDEFDLDSVKDDFFEESWTPFKYNGGIYAIPESQAFDVLFYRTDIFKELEITPPETWDEFYEVVRVIQSANLEVGMLEVDAANPGISASIGAFTRFLLQRGGRYYNDNLTKTEFDQNVAYEAFSEWVNLYKKYDFSRSFDFFNLFRSGEMPMGISGYATYNQLMAAAPEIRGLWTFAMVPGIRQKDGTIKATESGTGTACMMMNSAVSKGIQQEAFEFMSWWTDGEAQGRYARDLESVMGVAARYTPANLRAFDQISWTAAEKQVLMNQWRQVVNIPEVPGNYVVPRALTNAFRNAYSGSGPIHRQLDIYNKTINTEIEIKRKEFHLD